MKVEKCDWCGKAGMETKHYGLKVVDEHGKVKWKKACCEDHAIEIQGKYMEIHLNRLKECTGDITLYKNVPVEVKNIEMKIKIN